MNILEINHRVEDYKKWKSVFDEYPPSKGGATFHRIDRNVEDPNNITVITGFDTVAAARAFANDPDLKTAMNRGGVMGQPRIELYDEIESVEY